MDVDEIMGEDQSLPGQLPLSHPDVVVNGSARPAIQPHPANSGGFQSTAVSEMTANMAIPTTPEEVNKESVWALIKSKKRSKEYLDLMQSRSPWTPWSPLPRRVRNKETRACHCSLSRLHLLQCGHYVVTAGEAEPCAPNCAGMNAVLSPKIKAQMDRQEGLLLNFKLTTIDGDIVAYPGMFEQKLRPQGPEFGCRLCVRVALALLPDGGFRHPDMWLTLFRSEFIEEKNEAAALEGLRTCEVGFHLPKKKTTIPIRSDLDVAAAMVLQGMEDDEKGKQRQNPAVKARMEAKRERKEKQKVAVKEARKQKRASTSAKESKAQSQADSTAKKNDKDEEEWLIDFGDDGSTESGQQQSKSSAMTDNTEKPANSNTRANIMDMDGFDFSKVPKSPKASSNAEASTVSKPPKGRKKIPATKPDAGKDKAQLKAEQARKRVEKGIFKPDDLRVMIEWQTKNQVPDSVIVNTIVALIKDHRCKAQRKSWKSDRGAIKKIHQKKKEKAIRIDRARRSEKQTVLQAILAEIEDEVEKEDEDEGLAEACDRMEL